MKRILSYILMATLILALVGCKKNTGDDNVKPTDTPDTVLEATGTPTPTPAPDDASGKTSGNSEGAAVVIPENEAGNTTESGNNAESENTNESGNTAESGGNQNAIITTLTDEEYETIINTFSDYLRDVYMEDHYDETFEEIKYALGFIDEDDIPELLVTDGYYHACGTKVFKYIDGEVVFVGEFGEYGGFAFTPRMNNIYSFYYGMGNAINMIFSMNPDGSLTAKGRFEFVEEYDYENNVDLGTKYYVNDVETDEAGYDAAIEEFYYDGIDNWIMQYDYNFSSFSDTCYNRPEVMKYILDKALAGEQFTRYITSEMEAMVGEWELVRAEIYDYDAQLYGSFGSENVHSALSVTDDLYTSFWLSAWDENGENKLFKADYYMPMTFLPMGIYDGVENDEYSIRLENEEYDVYYYLVMFTDYDGVETLELVAFSNMIPYEGYENSILAYYHRVDSAEPVGTKYFGRLVACPERNRDDGTNAYLFYENMWITWDTPSEIKAQYGFADDLDGYDYEIVELDQEPMIVYSSIFGPSEGLNHYTCYKLIDYSTMQEVFTDFETFYDKVRNSYDGLYVYLYLEDGTSIANFITEEYTG